MGNMGVKVVNQIQQSYGMCSVVGIDPRVRPGDWKFPVFPDIGKVKIKQGDCSVLCIKPQDLKQFSTDFHHTQHPRSKDSAVISILAGVRVDTLKTWLPQKQICRAMPNLSFEYTPWYSDDDGLANVARQIFPSTGFRVENDNQVDVATIINGSGPAFLMQFCHCMKEEAIRLGVPPHLSKKFATGALKGSLELWKRDVEIAQICSKGGTTEAGMAEMSRHNFDNVVHNTISTSMERGRSLNAVYCTTTQPKNHQ